MHRTTVSNFSKIKVERWKEGEDKKNNISGNLNISGGDTLNGAFGLIIEGFDSVREYVKN